MNIKEGDILHETFNCQFDALFEEDCCDPGGRLHHIYQGKLGMGLITSYLSKINWTKDFLWDLMELKLWCLIDGLKYLQWVPKWLLANCIDGLLDKWMHLAQHEPSTPPQSSRTLWTLRPLNFPSSTKLSTIFTPDKPTRMTLPLHLQHQMLIHMHPPQPMWGWLPKTRIATCPSMTVTLKMKLLTSQCHICLVCVQQLLSHLQVQPLQPKRSVQQQLHHRWRASLWHQ